jgi:hypothetical protein
MFVVLHKPTEIGLHYSSHYNTAPYGLCKSTNLWKYPVNFIKANLTEYFRFKQLHVVNAKNVSMCY